MKNEQRLLTLQTIRDEILENFPKTLWWDGYHKHEVFNSIRSYKHRQGMPNEIRIEFDNKDTNQNWININETAINLTNEGYSFAIFYVEGGRGPHIHIYGLDELETLNYNQRIEYRNKFLTKICPKGSEPDRGLCDEKHLCALEFANHFKYKTPKRLLNHFWNGHNMGIDFDIKYSILHGEKKKQKIITNDKPLKFGDRLMKKRHEFFRGVLAFEKVFDKYKISYKGRKALCPFHADGDNSLSFSNEKGFWNCFGCGEKGDVVTLIKLLQEVKDDKNK